MDFVVKAIVCSGYSNGVNLQFGLIIEVYFPIDFPFAEEH